MREAPVLKTRLERDRMRLAAESLERVLADLSQVIKAGVTTAQIEHVATLALKRHGLSPALRGYNGYPADICTSVNNVAVHGLPGAYTLREGDIITVDVSGSRDGWYADGAWTYAIGPISNEARRLIRTAWRAALAGAAAARSGGRMGDIGAAIHATARSGGCRVIESCTGHGIGRSLHEAPVVTHTGSAGSGTPLVPGMVLNIEPVLSLGAGTINQLKDGWSYVTGDGSLAAQFELTVALSAEDSRILTLGRHGELRSLREPPYG